MPTIRILRAQAPGTVRSMVGQVVDTKGNPIGGALVKFVGNQVESETLSEKNGTYSVKLVLGKFLARVTRDGFCPYEQPIELTNTNVNKRLEFVLVDCSDCRPSIIDYEEPQIPLDGSDPHFPKPPTLSLKYQEEALTGQRSDGSRVRVRFGRKTHSAGSTVYKGLDCVLKNKPVILLYENGTLLAEKLTYWEVGKIDAEGEVALIDSLGVKHGTSAKIELLDGTARVTLNK